MNTAERIAVLTARRRELADDITRLQSDVEDALAAGDDTAGIVQDIAVLEAEARAIPGALAKLRETLRLETNQRIQNDADTSVAVFTKHAESLKAPAEKAAQAIDEFAGLVNSLPDDIRESFRTLPVFHGGILLDKLPRILREYIGTRVGEKTSEIRLNAARRIEYSKPDAGELGSRYGYHDMEFLGVTAAVDLG